MASLVSCKPRAMTEESVITAAATQKFPNLQLDVLKKRKKLGTFRERMDTLDIEMEKLLQAEIDRCAPKGPRYRKPDPRKGIKWFPCLHGNFGTGCKYSGMHAAHWWGRNTPCSEPAPIELVRALEEERHIINDTLIGNVAKKITDGERKMMRMRIAFALRFAKDHVNQRTILDWHKLIEKRFTAQCFASKEFKCQFFASDDFASQVCTDAVNEFMEARGINTTKKKVAEINQLGTPEPTIITDASQLTRGRQHQGYVRWDFDDAIRQLQQRGKDMPPKEPNFVERYQEGKATLEQTLATMKI